MTTPAITRFNGPWDYLSNFYKCKLDMANGGGTAATVEHAFQAEKMVTQGARARVLACATPSGAKQLARTLDYRSDWHDVREHIMFWYVQQKFARYPRLAALLRSTGDAELIEGNTWNDKTWGMCWDKQKQCLVGENKLGKILMRVRAEINAQ